MWDIYGNPLRKGHCEVHPHVHEEYPCSVCMSERKQQNEPFNIVEQLQHDFAMQGDYIRQLESDRKELTERIEQLKYMLASATSIVIDYHDENISSEEAMNDLWQVVNKTPVQHLAEIKAQAGRDGFIAGSHSERQRPSTIWSRLDRANEYANQIRQADKDGE